MTITHAAPTTQPTPSPGQIEAEALRGRSAKPGADADDDAVGSSRTLKMLLELQQAAPPPASRDLARDSGSTSQARPAQPGARQNGKDAARSQPASTNDWHPLPSATALDSLDRPSDLQPSSNASLSAIAPPLGATTDGGTTATRSAAHEDYTEARRLLSPTLVQFLRANRDWILIGSLGLVAAAWAIGAAARRRR